MTANSIRPEIPDPPNRLMKVPPKMRRQRALRIHRSGGTLSISEIATLWGVKKSEVIQTEQAALAKIRAALMECKDAAEYIG